MKRNHYGKWVDSEEPVGGVVTNHQPEFLCEDISNHGIDIDLEEYLATCESEEDRQILTGTTEEGTLIIGFKEWEHPEHDFETAVVMAEEHQPYAIVVGEKIFVPDNNFDYQAIVGEVYTQILRSSWVQRCNLCSPCYPGQGDLDTPGDYLAYTLPADMWGDRLEWRGIAAIDVRPANLNVVDADEGSKNPMPDYAFRALEKEDECQFRAWARKNYILGHPISECWHPSIRNECEKMNAEGGVS